MQVYVIYKQILDPNTGNVKQIELVECDEHEDSAVRFQKLANLQIPKDLKDRITHNYICVEVI